METSLLTPPGVRNLASAVKGLYKVSEEEVGNNADEIRTALQYVPVVVADFDDTMTASPFETSSGFHAKGGQDNFSIRAICREIAWLAERNPKYRTNKSETSICDWLSQLRILVAHSENTLAFL